jgi:hypothetical protein
LKGSFSASAVTRRAPGTYCSLTRSIAWLMSSPTAPGRRSSSSARKKPVPQPRSSTRRASGGMSESMRACQSSWNRRENSKL